jgi:adenine phosphoribosyltransferase
MSEKHETYSVNIAGLQRDLRLFEVAPGVTIAILNILGDTELVQACAKALAEKISDLEYAVLVTAEAKSIPLVHAISVETDKPYVVLRKNYKPYMGNAIKAETVSITTGAPQSLFLDEKDCAIVKGQRVVLLDDVVSTGSTQEGMRRVMEKAGAQVAAEMAVFTEGDQEKWKGFISLGHLPVWVDGG